MSVGISSSHQPGKKPDTADLSPVSHRPVPLPTHKVKAFHWSKTSNPEEDVNCDDDGRSVAQRNPIWGLLKSHNLNIFPAALPRRGRRNGSPARVEGGEFFRHFHTKSRSRATEAISLPGCQLYIYVSFILLAEPASTLSFRGFRVLQDFKYHKYHLLPRARYYIRGRRRPGPKTAPCRQSGKGFLCQSTLVTASCCFQDGGPDRNTWTGGGVD